MQRKAFQLSPLMCVIATFALAMFTVTAQTSPSWWTSRGVVNAGATPHDYAVANLGQLKWFTTNAFLEMEAVLPGGAGPEVSNVLASLATSGQNFAALNVGQLKATATPFYERLVAVGCETPRPWTETKDDDADHAVANLGQLKNVFTFAIQNIFSGPDTDSDSMADAWEMYYFGNLAQTQTQDADMDGLNNGDEYQRRTNPTLADTDNDGLSDFQEIRLRRVVAWGDNTKNQCTIPSEATDVVAVSAGLYHSLALRADRTVVAWGNNSYGLPASATNVVAVAAGANHSLALRADGTVVAWGTNSSGQTNVPASATNVIAIATGQRHSLALRADGRVVAWGFNYYGQATVPPSATNVIAVTAGGNHSLAITREGRIISWGQNNNVPTSATNVVTVADGPMHNLAIRSDDSVIGWGTSYVDVIGRLVMADNRYGQYSIPASVTRVVAVAVGEYHSLALRKDGTVIAWGQDDLLQCSGATNLSCVAAISAGLNHNLALIHGNPLKSDSDGDGMPDGWEVQHGFDPLNKLDAFQDPDADGLSNLSEFTYKTAPRNADTDKDGMPDGWELTYKLNPLNPEDAMLDLDQDHTLNKREYEMGSDPAAGYFLKETFDGGIPSDWVHGTYNGSLIPTPFDAPKWIATSGSSGLGLEQVLPYPKGSRGLNVGICNVGGRDNNRYGQSSLISPWINLGQGMTNVILHFYFSNPGFFSYNHYLSSSHDAYKGDQLVVYCRSRTRTAEGQEVFVDREIFNAKNPNFASQYWTFMSIRIPNPSVDCQIVFAYGYTYLGLGVYVDEVSITGDYGVIYKDQLPLVIETDSTLPSAKKGMPYSTQLSVRGGLRPFLWHYQWSVVSNALPQGLALDQNTGIISGTPTLPGTWNFSVEAKSDYGKVATNQFTLFVLDPFVALSEKFDSKWLPQGWTLEEQNTQSSWTAVPGVSPSGAAGSNVWYKGDGTTSPKLISPVMDLSKCTSNVVLRFYYRNPKSATGYRDYLFVYVLDGQGTTYMGASVSINSSGSFGESLPDADTWRQVVFSLPRLSATTQIAFRGLTSSAGSTPYSGGGIFLDEVEVLADYADPIFLAWIAGHFPDGNASGFDDDPDKDGLSNLKEYQKNTDPNDNDSDDDELMDGDEVARGTNPAIKDTDGDGLEDGAEVNTHHTDPLNPDTDGDDLPDGEELIQGTNPLNPDTDGDSLSDGWETRYGYSPLVKNDPSLDQDNDGLTDAQEFSANTNPRNGDTDKDGLSDAIEVRYGFNPNQFAAYVDTDKDGLQDKLEIAIGTNPAKWDTDGDCMSDSWEFYGGIDPLVAIGKDGQQGDPDGDGLSNFDEYINGTSPTEKDTDGDTISDKIEVDQGSNPLDKSDNGLPPPASELVEVPFTVGDPSGSHSERWQMNIKSLGPTDKRAFNFVNETFGTVGTKNFKLRKGNSYEITLQHQATASGNTTDYDWQAQIGGLPSTSVLEGGQTHPTATRFSSRNDLNILIDNEDGLLGLVNQSFETPNHTIGKKAKLYVLKAALVPDYNRDGKIDTTDRNLAKTGEPCRLWINDDKDVGDVDADGGTDIPGQTLEPNCKDLVLNGRRDLLDLFPILIDIRHFETICGTPDSYRIKQADGAVNMILTTMFDTEATKYQRSDVGYFNKSVMLPGNLHSAPVMPITAQGIEVDPAFVAWLRTNMGGQGVILVEGVKANSAPLVLEAVKDGQVIFSSNLPMFVQPVEEMFERVNLREGAAMATPSKWGGLQPAFEKNIFFLHGFRVPLEASRSWGSEMFKRLWQSGMNAKFHNITWFGNDGIGDGGKNYQGNVVHAFEAAPHLKDYIESVAGKKVVMAHSLGNMVVSSAIQDHEMFVNKYFMLNAAVPAEAYDGTAFSAIPANYLTHVEWASYTNASWSAMWHKLFSPEILYTFAGFDDDKYSLTWKGRFVNVASQSYNFYSTGDETLEIYNGTPSASEGIKFHFGLPIVTGTERYAWHKQEMYKGRSGEGELEGIFGTDMAGWGFEKKIVGDSLYPFYSASQANAENPQTFTTMPVFRWNPPVMFANTISQTNKNMLLSMAIPALSGPAGGRELGSPERAIVKENIDMNTFARPNGWGRTHETYGARWLHSDFKDVAYFYVYPLFSKFVEEGELK